MRIYRKVTYLGLLALISLSSCTKYLDKAPTADISEKDVFSNFNNYQGFVEGMYDNIIEWVHGYSNFGRFNLGGDDIMPTSNLLQWVNADYQSIVNGNISPYYNTLGANIQGPWNTTSTRRKAIWQNSWFGIRQANIAIAHLPELQVATDEQRKFIEGQAYFFRGYFHLQLIKAWGAIPYIDTVLTPSSDMKIPVKGLYETLEKVVSDLQRSAELLPVDWDLTATGQPTLNRNIGRATKGWVYANLAECLMFAASPLFNGTATGNYSYNLDYCKRAAAACWQVIKLANQGVYSLEPWATYSDMFYKLDNTFPRSKEIIQPSPQRGNCRYFASAFLFTDIGTDSWFDAPTQNYVELFETENGLPINDPESGFDPMNPWEHRDPRFRYNIMVDGDRRVKNASGDLAFAQLYTGGRDRSSTNSLTGFGMKKYWDVTINRIDNGWGRYTYAIPKLRLAEIYLIYAEMANEAYGPSGKDPDADLTAIDAVNIVRHRALMPDVNAKFLNNKEDFRARIWNERAVELAYESKRWYDIRRWHVAHLSQYRELRGLDFDEGHTYFKSFIVQTVPFAERNYWMPFPISQVNLYAEWKQNPGW
jgi:hypothetical protein